MLFLNKPENVITKVQIYKKGIQTEPLIWTRLDSINNQLLVDADWRIKAICKLG